MTTEPDDLEPEVDEAEVQAEAPEAEIEPPAPVDPALVEEARKYGWRPKEEFTLAPEGWVDAERFLELPQTQVKKYRDENRDYARRLEGIERTQKMAMDRLRQQERERFEAEIERIQSGIKKAAELGDVQEVSTLLEQQRKLQAPVETPQPTGPAPEVQAYVAQNEWAKDPMLWDFAVRAVDMNPEIKARTPAEQLSYAESKVKAMFPHMFQQAPAPVRQRVEGGGLATRRAGKGPSDLPPEARKAGEMYVQEGIYKTLEAYASDYFSEA